MRLAKYLAHSGVASRRRAEELVRAGRVSVAGAVVDDPARDVGDDDEVSVDGRPVAPEPREAWGPLSRLAVSDRSPIGPFALGPDERRLVHEVWSLS